MVSCSRLKKADCESTKGCSWVVGKGCSASATKTTKAPDNKKENKKKPAPATKKREAPPENDPLRKFYVSLLKERPTSVMAKQWCEERGLTLKAG